MEKYKNGLNDKEVEISRQKYGSNSISSVKSNSFFKLLLESLGDPIIKILLIALAIKTVFLFKDFDWYETIGIVIAILLASLISSISEYGSEKAFDRLQEESSKIKAKVKRNGAITEINIDDIVCNDIVVLQTGDRIPADGIIIEGEISVDESSLNGEAHEVYKYSANDVNSITDKNTVYRGTVVYSKEALMLVSRVGNETMYGKLAAEIQESQPDSPLKIRLRNLAKVISRLGYIGAFLVAFSYLFSVIFIENGFDPGKIISTIQNTRVISGHLLYALTLSVTIIVVAVPEGLPMMITLVLSSNMKRMLKDNVLVRKLVGIETAGSINILFTDKTGTLTKGKLEVVGVFNGDLKEYSSEAALKNDNCFYNILLNSVVNNSSSTLDNSTGRAIGGNITDKALLEFFSPHNIKFFDKVSSIPFNSKNKYSSTIIKVDNKKINLIKGAPEVILPFCTNYYDAFGEKKLLISKKKINDKIKSITDLGIRVIVIANNDNQLKLNSFAGLTLVGIILIKDDVREDAIEGVKTVTNAHIQTVMITGDNVNTAKAIAEEVGILKNKYTDVVLTSSELNNLTDDELKAIIPNLRVVARSLPTDKSRLIRVAQELGLVVGMTGDGVNDAPALKKADVGFAMGSGTEVAKEASDIVILDDNFLSISKACLFGRTIFKSIRKFIIFQLTVNLCAVSLSIIGPFIGVDTPVTVIQMLWINMVMDTLAGLAFAFEPPLKEYMNEYPKKKDEDILNSYMIGEILFTGVYSSLLCVMFLKIPFIRELFRPDIHDSYLLTAFFGLFIFIGIFNCFNARTSRINLFANILDNKVFLIIIAFIFFVQLMLIYFGGSLFRTTGLTFKELQIMILFAATVIPVDFLRKLYIKKRGLTQNV